VAAKYPNPHVSSACRIEFDLALLADVSARHVNSLESGRAKPSEEMVLRLMTAFALPLRDQNEALRAAGFASRFAEPGAPRDFADDRLGDRAHAAAAGAASARGAVGAISSLRGFHDVRCDWSGESNDRLLRSSRSSWTHFA
jgi:transcriptional regulator with XRE-family HTH domain